MTFPRGDGFEPSMGLNLLRKAQLDTVIDAVSLLEELLPAVSIENQSKIANMMLRLVNMGKTL